MRSGRRARLVPIARAAAALVFAALVVLVGVLWWQSLRPGAYAVTDHGAHTHSGAGTSVTAYAPDPAGMTSIGDGVLAAQALLAAATGYDALAVLVFTDGQQTAPAWIADVVPADRTFAVGLGTPADIDPAALTALTDGTGGYVAVTGALSVDERFVLARYFLRVLAGATNQQIAAG